MAASLRRGPEAEGYAVDVAADGEDGLWRATQESFDAVVLDLMVPKLNGFRVASALRAAGNDVPILILTAKDGKWDQADALDRGADDYLTKPFSYAVLLARLRPLVRRSRGSTGPELVAGDLRLDPAAHRCWRGDIEIELTAREFAVLETLILRAGHVVSKADLLEHVWGGDLDVTANAVEVWPASRSTAATRAPSHGLGGLARTSMADRITRRASGSSRAAKLSRMLFR